MMARPLSAIRSASTTTSTPRCGESMEKKRIACNFCHMAQDDYGQERCENTLCNAVIRPNGERPVQFSPVYRTPALPQLRRKQEARPRL